MDTEHGPDCTCDDCEFARIVDHGLGTSMHERWKNPPGRAYCPTCGQSVTGWPGCPDPFHDKGATP